MTMTRTEKATHQDIITNVGHGFVAMEFASPTEIRRRGGRRKMTRGEYIVFLMGRGFRPRSMARDFYDSGRRYRRRPVRR
jgi:hypothetical protein